MKSRTRLALAVVGITVVGLALSAVLAYRSAVLRDEAEWASFASQRIDDSLPMPFEIQRISYPGLFSLSGSINASVKIPGGLTKVLGSIEKHLRSVGWTVEKTEDSVGYQKGDLSLLLTHVSEDTYSYEETSAF